MNALPVPLVFDVDYPSDVRRRARYTACRQAEVMAVGRAIGLKWADIIDVLDETFSADELDRYIKDACSLLGPAHDGEQP
jgi:hypothetical protein